MKIKISKTRDRLPIFVISSEDEQEAIMLETLLELCQRENKKIYLSGQSFSVGEQGLSSFSIGWQDEID